MNRRAAEPNQTKSLWLIRHAKSAHPLGVEDMQRPLNARGSRDGDIMAKHLSDFEHPPQLFLVSDAVRTQQTAELINTVLHAKIDLVPALYSAGSTDVEDLLHGLRDEVKSVAIVTHLPTIERCLWSSKTHNIEFFPTLAMARLEYIGRWESFRFHSAMVRKFVVPRSFR